MQVGSVDVHGAYASLVMVIAVNFARLLEQIERSLTNRKILGMMSGLCSPSIGTVLQIQSDQTLHIGSIHQGTSSIRMGREALRIYCHRSFKMCESAHIFTRTSHKSTAG